MSPVNQSLSGSPRWEQQPLEVGWEMAVPRGAVAREATWHELTDGSRDLDTLEAQRMIRDLAAGGVSVLTLVWSGGPLRRDLGELLQLAARDGLETWLKSAAGVALDADAAASLAGAGLAGFSARIDTPDPERHDEASVAALRAAREAGLLLCAETPVGRRNIDLLPAIRTAIAGLGVARWHLCYPVSDVSVMPTADQVEVSLRQLVDVEEELGFSLELTAAPQYLRVRAMRGLRGPVRVRVLGDGRGLMFVSYCGDIFPSRELLVPCGNLRMHDLLDVYRFHPTFRTLRDPGMLRGRCGGCEYQRTCGGSRARAYALEGSLLGADPLCPHSPRALVPTSFP